MANRQLFLPELDGLRFFAFLAVFIHHSPAVDFIPAWNFVREYGWVGVELFFVISAYLFFHLLSAEQQKKGSISAGNFYRRRALRILPLMWVFPIGMFLFYSDHSLTALVRTAGVIFGVDNMLAWVSGYSKLPYSTHLWTLSFELQIYLVIPLAFFAYLRFGRTAFLQALTLVWAFCLVFRTLVALSGAAHPIVWVTPFLRPEAVLLGLAMSMLRPSWNPILSIGIAIAAITALALLPPLNTTFGMIAVYPFTALAAAFIVDAALRQRAISRLMRLGPLQFLGKISFGLYVFHFIGMAFANSILLWAGLPANPSESWRAWALWMACALSVTTSLSLVSYYLLEKPFLNLKARKYSVVDGRSTADVSASI